MKGQTTTLRVHLAKSTGHKILYLLTLNRFFLKKPLKLIFFIMSFYNTSLLPPWSPWLHSPEYPSSYDYDTENFTKQDSFEMFPELNGSSTEETNLLIIDQYFEPAEASNKSNPSPLQDTATQSKSLSLSETNEIPVTPLCAKKRQWTKEEDNQLIKAVEQYSTASWKNISVLDKK